jgi:glycosyltransferase involved in cell wall biosynthesis
VTSVCYIDAAMRDNAGHHTNACRHFVSEFRRRGIVVDPFGNRGLDTSVARELQVEPLFRHLPYTRLRGGAYVSYLVERISFLFDLRSAWRHGPYDLVFIHSVMAAQLAAIALWLREFGPSEMPFVIIGIDLPSGRNLSGHWSYYTPFYLKAGRLFRSGYLPRILFFTFDPAITKDYAELLNVPVQTMPAVHAGLGEPRLRKRDSFGLINVAFLGHQRDEKGYHLIPDIVRRLFDRRLSVKVLIHNSAPGESPINRELQSLAGANKNIAFVEGPGDQSSWQDLLDRADLVVLPYEPNRYRESGSGVATEAVSDGIPMVVPLGTTMETLAVTHQGCATTFGRWRAEEVADAIEEAVSKFEVLARQAQAGALVWRRNNGVEVFVDRLLELATCSDRAKFPNHSSYDAVVGRILDVVVSRLTR